MKTPRSNIRTAFVVLCVVIFLDTLIHSAKIVNLLELSHYRGPGRQLLHAGNQDSESIEEKLTDDFNAELNIKLQDEGRAKSDEDKEMSVKMSEKSSAGFMHGFVASFSVIIVSEIGDKTFFIAAIMAMTHSQLSVLTGALTANFVMHFLSSIVGYAATVIPRALMDYASSALFVVFGVKMLREGWHMTEDEAQEEYEEVQADLKRREDERKKQKDGQTGIIQTSGRFLMGILSAAFLQSFTLTFLAEWGDRSQIATIVLGAREDVLGVMLGGFFGHTVSTSLAVLGGKFTTQRISVRTVTLIGGVMFIIFALSALWISPDTT